MRPWIPAVMLLGLLLGASDQPCDLPSLIAAAEASGKHELVLPRGRYDLGKSVALKGLRDFTLAGETGSAKDTTLVLRYDPEKPAGILIRSCVNFALKGISVDYDPPPFTQARITAKAENGESIDYEIAPGFHGLDRHFASLTGYYYESDGSWKKDVAEAVFLRNEIIDARHGRAFGRPARMGGKVGDRLVLYQRTGANAFSLDGCSNVTMENVSVYASPNMAFCSRYMQGQGVFRGLFVGPGPRPDDAAEDRLLSTCGDAFNYAFTRQGPRLENCDFSRQGDDSVNAFGHFFPIVKVERPNKIWLARQGNEDLSFFYIPNLRKGDGVRLLRFGNYAIAGTRPFMAMAADPQASNLVDAPLAANWDLKLGEGARPIKYFRIDLEGELPPDIRPGDGVDFPCLSAPGLVVRGCYFHDHRANGIRLRSSHSIIESNRIERIRMAAIGMGHQYASWREAGWLEDVQIRGNTLRDNGYEPYFYLNPESGYLGALTLQNNLRKGCTAVAGNRQVVIAGNLIDGCSMNGIVVCAASGVVITNNTLRNLNQRDGGDTGSALGLAWGYAISTFACDGVRVTNNTVEKPGPFSKGAFAADPKP